MARVEVKYRWRTREPLGAVLARKVLMMGDDPNSCLKTRDSVGLLSMAFWPTLPVHE